jgi:magnesium chelatase subunit D
MTTSPNSTIDFTQVLACAALSPDPCGLLVLGATPREVASIASAFEQMLAVTAGLELGQAVQLGMNESEDDLWGVLSLRAADSKDLKSWHRPGLLTRILQQSHPGLVVIPDISRISLASKRAIVTTLGAPEVYFERHGLHEAKSVNIYWLAGCSKGTIGSVSRHLLDRFAYRVLMPAELVLERNTALTKRLSSSNSISHDALSLIPSLAQSLKVFLPIIENVRDNVLGHTRTAISRVISFFPDQGDLHIRRQISLARLAGSLAQLNRKTVITAEDVDKAANIAGLRIAAPPLANISDDSLDKQPAPQPDGAEPITLNEIADTQLETESNADKEFPSDQLWENVALSPLTSHYPEDDVLPQREFNDLRYPMTRRGKSNEQGLIVGIERTNSLVDLSITATIFEAARYQRIRLRNNPHLGDSLSITATDLRRHRRSSRPDQMLLLLLDHTCARNRHGNERETNLIEAIENALVTHLRWAYFERASVTVIEVGRRNAANELRAEKVSAEAVVNPRIATALELQPGKATPLAHGLNLVHETLRRSFWQGRAQPRHVRLVIFTDGRGNVPLSASLLGEITPPIHSEGVADAVEQARKIRDFSQSENLRRVEAYFLSPQTVMSYSQAEQPRYASQDVRLKLAREMNAKPFLITFKSEGED